MPLSKEAIKIILGITEPFDISAEEMAQHLEVTFFPKQVPISDAVDGFASQLENILKELGCKIIPYEKTLKKVSLYKVWRRQIFFFIKNLKILFLKLLNLRKTELRRKESFLRIKSGRKIREGIAIISLGEGISGDLPADYRMSLRHNPIINIIDKPKEVSQTDDYIMHTEMALKIFAWNIANILITIGDQQWTIYSHNSSFSSYSLKFNLKESILNNLIPKIVASVQPPNLRDFVIKKEAFDVTDHKYLLYVKDLVESGPVFAKTGLYPSRKLVSELIFRNNFYKWIGSLHLDHRKGMSYGFFARQLPVKLSKPILLKDAKEKYKDLALTQNQDWVIRQNGIYVIIKIKEQELFLRVPDVWVLTSKSGSEKTHLHPMRDIIKLGLINGRLFLQTPRGIRSLEGYRPSFDTRVILAHAVSNAIFASVCFYLRTNLLFVRMLTDQGIALAHWHGYVLPKLVPKGWYYYGSDNLPVSCSSPQSAFYAFSGKEKAIIQSIANKEEFLGDIHIEPDHGTNMSFRSLKSLAYFFLSNPTIAKLGNEYFQFYKNQSQ